MLPAFPLAFIQNLFDSPIGLIVLFFFAVLLFGRRLPEIGKNVGKTIVEFKKGLNQAKDEISDAAHEPEEPQPQPRKPVVISKTAPRQIKQISAASEEP